MALQGSIVITAQVDSGQATRQLQDIISRLEAVEAAQRAATGGARQFSNAQRDAISAARSTLDLDLRRIQAMGGGYEESRRALLRYTESIRQQRGAVDELADAQIRLREMERAQLNERADRLRAVGQTISIGMGIAAGALGAAGVASIKLAADLEQSKVAFTTLLGSAEKADVFLRDLAKFAAATPFEFVGLQDSARRLLAFGFAAQDIIPLMNAIGSAVAGLGGGKEQIDLVTLALGQMQAKGKVSAEEMNQLAELGIPAWKMIASAIGVSIPEAMKRAERGAIDSTTAINALINGMNEKFPGMLEKQSKTINGVFSNLVDGATRTATLIGERLIRAFHVADIIGNAASIIAGFAATIENAGFMAALDKLFPPGLQITIVAIAGALTASMIPAIIVLTTALGEAALAAGPLLLAGAAVGGLAYTIARNWEGLTRFFSGLFSGIAELAAGVRDRVGEFFARMFSGVRDGLLRLLQVVRGALDRVGAFVPQPVKDALAGAIENVQKFGSNVAGAVGNATRATVALGRAATTAIGSGLQAVGSFFTPDVKALIDMAKSGKVDTTFKGITAPPGQGAAAAAAAGSKAGKPKAADIYGPVSKEGERQKAIDLAKAQLDVALKQSEIEKDGAAHKIQALYEYYTKLQEFGATAEQIEAARVAVIKAGNDAADDAQKKYIENQKKIADEEKKRIDDTAEKLHTSLKIASEIWAGDFSAITAQITQTLENQLVNALANSPAVTNAMNSLGTFLTGPVGIAVMFGSLLTMGIMGAADQARIAAQKAKDDAIEVDKLLHPEKYQQVSPRAQALLDKANEVQKKIDELVANYNMRAQAEQGPLGGMTALLNKTFLGGSAADLKKQIDDLIGQRDNLVSAFEKEAGRVAITMGVTELYGKDGFNPFAAIVEMLKNNPGIAATAASKGGSTVMPGETPDKPIYTQVVNVRDFREAFPDTAYFRAPSVDTTRSLNANAVAYR